MEFKHKVDDDRLWKLIESLTSLMVTADCLLKIAILFLKIAIILSPISILAFIVLTLLK